MFETLERFVKVAPKTLTDPVKKAKWQGYGFGSVESMAAEICLMKQLVEKHCKSPLGFTHNDLLLANIIYNDDRTRVNFIDFEYGSYNYVYYDIGDHFTEFAGTDDVDHSLYPDEQLQKQWLAIYLQERNLIMGAGDIPVADNEIEMVRNEVNLFALCAHLFWAVWTLIQAEHSKIDFDYVYFGARRMAGYYENKERFTKPFTRDL